MVKFREDGHLYTSLENDGIKWISVTTLVHKFVPPFDARAQAMKSTRNTRSKWFRIPVDEILKAWEGETRRSTDAGSWYHGKREQELYAAAGLPVQVIKPVMDGGDKLAPNQKLLNNYMYPELLVYLLSANLCGQSDKVVILDNKVNISDYKTSKEIRRNAYSGYNGPEMLLAPLNHLENCEFNIYALQLSIYMYIILRHNPEFSPGTLTIEHIKFEKEADDKYGYPIYRRNASGEFVVKDIEYIQLPYMRREVQSIIEWLKENK